MTELIGYVWNEGEEPTAVRGEDYDKLREAVCQLLEEKEHGKIAVTRDGVTLELLFQAFTDPQRGRACSVGVNADDLAKNIAEMKKAFEVECFSPVQLYDMRPIRKHYDLYHLVTVHMQEEVDSYQLPFDAIEATKNIEIRTIADECPDGRRTWTLETVWYRGMPVMVVNSSGRDGDEYYNRYITNRYMFEDMVAFIRSFIDPKDVDVVDVYKIIPEMTEFYNATIHDYYDVKRQVRKDKRHES